jgi:hypothetical protein
LIAITGLTNKKGVITMRSYLSAILVVLIASSAFAAGPKLLSYQGRVLTSGGAPVADASYPAVFAFYTESSGGALLWTESGSVTTSDGLFTHILGSISAIPASVFTGNSSVWLEATVNGELQTPRNLLTSAGNAIAVTTVDGASGGIIASNIIVNGRVTAVVSSFEAISGTSTVATGLINSGVVGQAFNGNENRGVFGYAQDAGNGNNSAGIYGFGESTSGGTIWAGYFEGLVNVTGAFSAASKSFRIDHPLDPSNKELQHACVESDQHKNVYDGLATTDASGVVNVTLPSWFDALNSDCRYQLTVIGQFAQAIVSSKIVNNQFTIQTDKPNVEVSWQVTGIRKDPYVLAHPLEVERLKSADMRGKYLHPVEYGVSKTLGVDYEVNKQSADERARREAE